MEAWETAANDYATLEQQINETKNTISDLGSEYERTSGYIAKTETISAGMDALLMLGKAASGTGSDISSMSDEAIEAYNKMYNSLQETVWNQMDLFSKFTNEVRISKEEILQNMQSQIDGVSQWAENMDELARRGIDEGLLKYLADMGPQGSAYVAEFVKMSEEQLADAGKMFEDAVTLSYSSAMNITDSYFEAGQNMSQGLADGAMDNMDAVLGAVSEMAEGSIDALKRGLDEHSPSKATQEIGENFDEGLKLGINDNGDKVLAIIRQLTGTMLAETKTGIPSGEYKKIGIQMMEGLRSGIESGKSKVLESVRTMCEETIQAAKDKLDIHSPSKAFEYLGEMSGEGYTAGWVDSMEDIDSVIMENLPDMVLLNDEIRDAYGRMVADAETFCLQILAANSTIDALGDEYDETMSDMSDNGSVEKVCENMKELGSSALDAGTDIAAMSKETIQAYQEMYSSVSEKVGSQIDLFSEFSGEAKLSAEDLLKNMQSQVTGVAQWAMDMDTLADRGINQGLLQHLADMGPAGAGYVSTFVNMTDEQLSQASKLFETSLVLPDATAMLITDSFAKAGADAAKGLADGIASGTNEVEDASESMSCDALETVMTTLDEHSPSKKTEEMGLNFDEGLKKGIDTNKDGIFSLIRQVTSGMITDTRLGLPTEEFTEIGQRVAEGLQEGIESGKSGVIAAIQSMCASAVESAKSALDIHSPSRAFAWLGQMSGEGYISGWEDTMENINSVIKDSLPEVRGTDAVNGYNSGTSGAAPAQVYDMCSKIYGIMAQYLPEIASMQMVTDTGALIGEILPQLDREFGEMQYDKIRGVYE